MSRRFKVGDRVRYTGSPVLGPSYGATGTVGLVAGPRGQSVHPDPARIMTFVNWDDGSREGVYTRDLERT